MEKMFFIAANFEFGSKRDTAIQEINDLLLKINKDGFSAIGITPVVETYADGCPGTVGVMILAKKQ